jgi:hypothetical protein
MVRKRADAPGLHFHGPPPVLEALAPAQLEATVGTLVLDTGTAKGVTTIAPLAVQAVPAGPAATRLLLSLPETTPPGSYTGSVQLMEQRHPVTVDVHPQTNLMVTPPYLKLRAAAGAEVDVELTLLNAGNVDFEVARVHAFNLLQLDSFEDAVHAALRHDPAPGQGRLDRFLDELAARHGGLVRVAIEEGVGTIAPAESRRLRARLHLPGELAPGATYSSTWRLGNLNLSVEVLVESAVKTPSARRAG